MSVLRLRHVDFERVEFDLVDEHGEVVRPVVVRVVPGASWASAVMFPTLDTDGGETIGDDVRDRWVRERAAEELARLAAAVDAARDARGAA